MKNWLRWSLNEGNSAGKEITGYETSVGERGAWVATQRYTFRKMLYFNIRLTLKLCHDKKKFISYISNWMLEPTLNNFDVEEIEWKKAQIKNLSTKP